MKTTFVTAAFCLFFASMAWASELSLPAGLQWCQTRVEVEERLGHGQELTGDVYDANKVVWAVDGFISAVFEEDRLIGVRFRAFETPSAVKKVITALGKNLGKGGERRSGYHWSPGKSQSVDYKVQSEQIYVNYEVPFDYCGNSLAHDGSLSDQEKADLKSLEEKKVVTWDPYSDSIEASVVDKKDEKKKDEAKEKEEKEDKEVKDGDIDW